LGESELASPLTQSREQRCTIDHQFLTPLHRPILETRSLTWPDEAACAAHAGALARRPALRNAYIELHGPLGAGKTTFVRHLLRGLGVQGRIKSPTYAVMEPYEVNGLPVSHFDFYRFGDAREWDDAGFRDVFAQAGLKLAEWPENARAALPVADLRITIEPREGPFCDMTRDITLEALTPVGAELLRTQP
jgi:tRNA threonylcarbamoyladenosine biosynthesis protein TsaE